MAVGGSPGLRGVLFVLGRALQLQSGPCGCCPLPALPETTCVAGGAGSGQGGPEEGVRVDQLLPQKTMEAASQHMRSQEGLGREIGVACVLWQDAEGEGHVIARGSLQAEEQTPAGCAADVRLCGVADLEFRFVRHGDQLEAYSGSACQWVLCGLAGVVRASLKVAVAASAHVVLLVARQRIFAPGLLHCLQASDMVGIACCRCGRGKEAVAGCRRCAGSLLRRRPRGEQQRQLGMSRRRVARSHPAVRTLALPLACMASMQLTAYRNQQKRNMKEIEDACSDNVELQAVVLETIRAYKAATKEANLGEQARAQTARGGGGQKKKDELTNDEMSEKEKRAITHDATGAEIQLMRGRFLYRNWGIKNFKELLLYCVPNITKSQVNGMRNVERAKEVVEFAWDLRICDGNATFDRVGSTSKREVLETLGEQYIQKGRRLDRLLHCLSEGFVNWSVHGHYDLQVSRLSDEKLKVGVKHKLLKSTRHVPEELLEQDDFGGCEIRANYSQNCAYLWTASGESYPISSLFPAFMKKGIKQVGEGSPAVGDSGTGTGEKRPRLEDPKPGSAEATGAGSVMALPPPEQVLREHADKREGVGAAGEEGASAEEDAID